MQARPEDLQLTAEQMEQAEAKAAEFLKTADWPTLWCILAELGRADSIGGYEYLTATEEELER